MAQKCVHKGCGKEFTDPDEPCVYHPGPPIFHEGQKGWKCCSKRVLTFDEFMSIPPCTTGKHSTVDDTPVEATAKPSAEEVEAKIKAQAQNQAPGLPAVSRAPIAAVAQPPQPSPSPAPPEEEEDDDPDTPIPAGATCKRKACGATYTAPAPGAPPRHEAGDESCVHHPGRALFHEGSKGWTCCKRRVLEFDEFMRIPGCTTRARHLFVGKKKTGAQEEERLTEIRNDFYQTATTVIASLYLKKIEKDRSRVVFGAAAEGVGGGRGSSTVELDLVTTDKKRYQNTLLLYGAIQPEKSSFKIMGTKLELSLAKADGAGWPVLRATDPHTGEIIQAGRAGRV